MNKKSLVTVLLVGASHVVLAQSPPSAGSQLQQIPNVQPILPPASALDVPAAPADAAVRSDVATGPRFKVNRLKVTGASRYPEAELLAVSAFQAGSEVTLHDLNVMAARITDRYRRDGYLVARAHLPAQEIKDGEVTITVLEGNLGQVKVNNSANVRTSVAASMLAGLNEGDVISLDPIEGRLLLLSDLPGLQVRSTLVPGASPGLSDLIVNVAPGSRWSGSVDADNAGSRYTGAHRAGGQINLNNPFGLGDVASVRGLTSGQGLNYLRGSYQMPVGKGRLGVAYSHLAYELGREFEPLDANGKARIASLFGSYPLLRSRSRNVNLGLTLDNKTFNDRIDSVRVVTDKRARTATASLYGDSRDSLGGLGGVNSYSLAWSSGSLDIRTPAARAFDATTARTNGRYNKLAFNVSRLQRLSDTVSLMGSASGQWASKNLDVSEKMELGGMYGVRAYPEGEAYADQGYLLSVELRKRLTGLPASFPGDLQVLAFVDGGAVTLNHKPWAAGTNRRNLLGAGVGASWSRVNDFSIRAYYARKVGDEAAISAPDKSGRFWIQAVKYF